MDTLVEGRTLIVGLLFLIFGISTSSVILSMKMKDALRKQKREHDEKLQDQIIKSDDKKEAERQAWADKKRKEVLKEEKKKRKK